MPFCAQGYETRGKVVKSVHYVPKTGASIERVYSDLTSLSGRKSTTVYPKTVSLALLGSPYKGM